MSTADNGRIFFIDHVNKRTTWVRKTRKNHRILFIRIYFKIDPRTGKPTLLPVVQKELSQNGPLPVCKQNPQ